MPALKFIRLDHLSPPQFDARLEEDPDDFQELVESIRQWGILEPLIVRQTAAGYEIIAGGRRFRAARAAGLAAAPCDVRKASDAESDAIKLHENLKRRDMTHVEQAHTFEHLRTAYDLTEDQIGAIVGRSKAYVSQHLTLLHTDPVLVQALQDGRLNFSVARELMQIDDEDERHRFMRYALDGGASAEVAHEWVRTWKKDAAELPDRQQVAVEMTPASVSHEPMYVCAGCERPTELSKLRLVRYCPDCYLILMAALAEERRTGAHQEPHEPRSPSG